MLKQNPIKTLLLALVMLAGAALPASAQLFGGREASGDTAELLLRIDRLENQIRTMNGRMEEMQFQVRRSEEMLRKFQQDVDFRFQELQPKGGARPAAPSAQPAPAPVPPQRRGDLEPELGGSAPNLAQAAPAAAPAIVAGVAGSRGNGRGDAFDPAANPDAPGAPRALGSPDSASRPVARPVPGGPLGAQDDANAPLDLTGGRQAAIAAPPAQAGTNSSLGAMPATTPKDEFELAVFSLERGQYDAAEASLATFLQRYPKDPLAGEAVYYLGESFFKRNRHRDAAEQFLKISTDHPKTAHAPDAMLRLGQSLEKLGAKEQACAFYAEVPRKYPQANAIKTTAQREFTRAKCS